MLLFPPSRITTVKIGFVEFQNTGRENRNSQHGPVDKFKPRTDSLGLHVFRL